MGYTEPMASPAFKPNNVFSGAKVKAGGLSSNPPRIGVANFAPSPSGTAGAAPLAPLAQPSRLALVSPAAPALEPVTPTTPATPSSSLAGGGGGAFSSFSPFFRQPPAPPAPPQPEVVRATKDAELQSLVQDLLAQVRGLSTDPSEQQGRLQKDTRSEGVQRQIEATTAQNQLDANNARQSVQEFAQLFLAAQPEAQRFADEETAAIGEFFDGSLEDELAQIRANERLFATQNLQRRLGGIGRQGNLASLTSGAPDSYVAAQIAQAIADASLQHDAGLAAQERQDLLGLAQARTGLTGQRQSLIDAMLNRTLIPTDAMNTVANQNLSRLGQLGNLENLNNVFQFFTPQELLAQQVGLAGNVGNISLANQFLGLRMPFEPDASGQIDFAFPNLA